MADDIEHYLQKVEAELFNVPESRRSSFVRSETDDEVTKLIEDLDASTNSLKIPSRRTSTYSQDYHESIKGEKCFPLLIGAADTATGLSTVPNPRTCDTLRCTSCDRSIVALPHCAWQPDIDALFLRQAAVHPAHLSEKLEPLEGARAYACQCQCFTVVDGTQSIPQRLPWVCGKHK